MLYTALLGNAYFLQLFWSPCSLGSLPACHLPSPGGGVAECEFKDHAAFIHQMFLQHLGLPGAEDTMVFLGPKTMLQVCLRLK